jgi:hypothetical protein
MNTIDLARKINDLLIVREDDGTYVLFAKYIISSTNEGYYNITIKNEESVLNEFSSLKHAVTWCVFDNNKKYKEVKRIQELDSLLGSLDVSIAQHKKLAYKHNDNDDKFIYLAKLHENKLKKKQALIELDGYITLSKYWQTKKFDENISSKAKKNDK